MVVDRLTRYAHFMALKQQYSAALVARLYLDNVYKLHGISQAIVCDCVPIFLSTFGKICSSCKGVELHLSSAYHPQYDGQIEVVNRCLECYLRCMCSQRPNQLFKWLSLAEWWYNTSFHSSLQTTPFHALCGMVYHFMFLISSRFYS